MSTKLLDGRVAVVTGAGKGLGRAYAQWLAAQGCAVVVNNRSHPSVPSSAQALVDQIQAAGGVAIANHAAVEDRDSAEAMVELATEHFGKLDILVCNAGVMPEAPFATMDAEEIVRLININVLGTIFPLQPAWRHMLGRGYGRIVLTGSTVGVYGFGNVAAYGASRATALGLARSLNLEKPPGADIGVNVIMPFAYTNMSAEAIDQAMPAAVSDLIQPDRIAPTVGWLCTDACKASGQVFHAYAHKVTRIGIVESQPVDVDPANVLDLSKAEFSLAPLFEPRESSESVSRLLAG